MSTYYGPDSVLGPGDAALNKTDHAPSALERIPCKANEEPSEDFFFSSQIDIHFHAEFYILFFNCFSKQGPQIYMLCSLTKFASAPVVLRELTAELEGRKCTVNK